MILNKKVLTLAISTVIGVNYIYPPNALAGLDPINGGVNTVYDGKITYNEPSNDAPVTGVRLSNSSDSLTVYGAATISLIGKGDTTGIFMESGSKANLGSSTVIDLSTDRGNSAGITIYDSTTKLEANNLTIKSNVATSGIAGGINLRNNASAYLTGTTSITVKNPIGGFAQGLNLQGSSSLTLDKLMLISEGFSGATVSVEGGSSLTLGDDSSIEAGMSGLFATETGTTVNLNKATITSHNGNGVQSQNNAIINLGSGTTINSSMTNPSSGSVGIWALSKATITGDHLTVNSHSATGAIEAYNATIKIGAGSSVTSSNSGILANATVVGTPATVDFKGSANERNTLTSNIEYALRAKGSGALVNVENTDITVNINNPSIINYGANTYNGGIINLTGSSITIDNGGSAVMAESNGIINLEGNTTINAGSNLKSALAAQGTNAKVDVTGKATINGNLYASGSGSSIDLDLTQGSRITGYSTIDTVSPGATLNFKMAGSTWNMNDNSQVNQLTLNNSKVNFSGTGFKTLTTDSLSGTNGLFDIRTAIKENQGDLIVVKGTAQGTYKINVTNNGSENTDGTETLTIVKTNGNQANFSLTNKVELGAYEYDLRRVATSNNDLELYASGKSGGNKPNLTTTAQAASSFLNIGYLTNYIENQTLLQRLGDLRNNESMGLKSDGFWVKGFGGKLNSFSGRVLDKFDMTYTGTQLGIDKQISTSSGNLLLGAMAGFTRTNPNYREGNGNGKNYTAGLYATYYLDDGLYVDSVLKYNSMHNHFNVKDTAGQAVKGTGKTQGISLSTEVGKRFWLSNNHQGVYIEPQAQLTYGYQNGDTVHSSNGLKVGLSHYNSTQGRISSIVGYQTQGTSPVNVYLKTGVVREMSGGANYRFNNGVKNGHSFRSSWFDNGIGANVNINKRHNIYAEADYSTGNHFDNAMLNVGYRYSF